MAAGGSADAAARRARRIGIAWARKAQQAYQQAGRFEAAARSERRVASALAGLTAAGWRLLVDRHWPGTASANVDMILIGPGGVYVLDIKRWRDTPVVEGGHLTAAGRIRDAEIDKLLAVTRIAEEKAATLGLTPVAVHPLLVFAGHRLNTRLSGVRLLGEPDVVPALQADRKHLTSQRVRTVTHLLEQAFPAHAETGLDAEPAADGTEQTELFDVAEVQRATLRALLREPIERWMTFLHPDQIGLVRRDWNGPARISGPAGTGKSVVGLHRAAYLAARDAGPVLYVTYAKNLPRVLGRLCERLAGPLAGRAEFTGLHAWAQSFLTARGIRMNVNRDRAEDAFARAWVTAGRDGVLGDIDPAPGYWREEIDHVIKGRGLRSLEEYRAVPRHGRRTALRPAHREAAWLLYEEYELLLAERGVHDFNDLLLRALEEVVERPLDPPYGAVIVDEVQDLTLAGVRLLHRLAGDRRNGLLLIGDGQQAVYPGGFRLAEAGLDIKGRGAVLRTNYRNATEILGAALELVAGDAYDDLDGPSTDGRRTVHSELRDGQVVRVTAADVAEHDRRLMDALRELREEGALPGAALLCGSLRSVNHYQGRLVRAGIPVVRLEQYDGRPVPAVKLGTFRRAKGLEFKRVFLPRVDLFLAQVAGDGAVARERGELVRRQLFVAMTRARDRLWLGSVAPAGDPPPPDPQPDPQPRP
ncbi:MAG: AAA family ATPase [Streptosporangiales bacterium]|nr:AAA family ATPase [Streptosporangiales bacterium]